MYVNASTDPVLTDIRWCKCDAPFEQHSQEVQSQMILCRETGQSQHTHSCRSWPVGIRVFIHRGSWRCTIWIACIFCANWLFGLEIIVCGLRLIFKWFILNRPECKFETTVLFFSLSWSTWRSFIFLYTNRELCKCWMRVVAVIMSVCVCGVGVGG